MFIHSSLSSNLLLFFVLRSSSEHCIAYGGTFNSQRSLLWRIGSLVTAFIPSVPFVGALFFTPLIFLDKYDLYLSVSLPKNVTDMLGNCRGTPRRDRTHCIYAGTSLATEKATRECLLCDQLGQLFASYMTVSDERMRV